MKKLQSNTKIVHKEADISKYLHLYLLTRRKNSVSYLLLIDSDARINLKCCRKITKIQDHLFSTPFHGNQFYFHVKKFIRFFNVFFLIETKNVNKKHQLDTKIGNKEAKISKYLHLYLLTLSKNSVSSLLFIEFDKRIKL